MGNIYCRLSFCRHIVAWHFLGGVFLEVLKTYFTAIGTVLNTPVAFWEYNISVGQVFMFLMIAGVMLTFIFFITD